MRVNNNQEGFSIVEMLASMLAFSILILSVGIILIRGWQGWRYSNESVAMQRDASLAFGVIAREIRCSSIANIVVAGERIDFLPDGVVRVAPESIERQGDDLVYTGSDGGSMALLNGTATGFLPIIQDNSVEVTLSYQTPSGQEAGSKTVAINARN